MLKNIRRYGSPQSAAEAWALKIRDYYVKICKETPTPEHHLMIVPGMFPMGTCTPMERTWRPRPTAGLRGIPFPIPPNGSGFCERP